MRIYRHQLDLTFNSCHIISNRSVTNFSLFLFFVFLRQLPTSTKKIFRPCRGLQLRFSRATIQLGGFSVLPQSTWCVRTTSWIVAPWGLRLDTPEFIWPAKRVGDTFTLSCPDSRLRCSTFPSMLHFQRMYLTVESFLHFFLIGCSCCLGGIKLPPQCLLVWFMRSFRRETIALFTLWPKSLRRCLLIRSVLE